MSGKVVGWAMEQRTGSPTSKLVLVKLADNANEEGLCWPSLALIVEHTELSARSVRDHVAKLEEAGLIAIERRESDGVHLPNRYQLLVPWRRAGATKRPEKRMGGSAGAAPPLQDVPGVVQDLQGGSAGAAPGVVQEIPAYIEEPSTEPSIEPSSEPEDSRPAGAASQPSLLLGIEPVPLHKPKPLRQDGPEAVAAAFDAYDRSAAHNGWSACSLRDGRVPQLRRRLVEAGGITGWEAALAKAEASDFLMGRVPGRNGQGPFKMNIDFLLQQSKFVKLMEGQYDNRTGREGTGNGGGGVLAAAARVAARRTAQGAH